MPSQRFLIAPLQGGFVSNVRPWLIPEDAFEQLNNMYVFRGRIRKRFGSKLMVDQNSTGTIAQLDSRLRVQVGTLGAPVSPVPTAVGAIGQMFSAGDVMFTVWQVTGDMLVANGSATTKTFDTTTGVFVINGVLDSGGTPLGAGTAIFWYPALPVMGITENDTNIINAQPTYAFDTRFAYTYLNGGWSRLTGGDDIWKGGDDNYFWNSVWYPVLNTYKVLFATNFYFTGTAATSDAMRYWDGNLLQWVDYTPNYLPDSAGTSFKLFTARIVLGFQNRLVWMNVVKNVTDALGTSTLTQFSNEIWFSVYNDGLTPGTSFNHPNNANLLILPTSEQIISAQLLKNRCIIFCERSTWEMVYTGNEVEPFRIQKINTELGVGSTFSVVPFDQVVLGIGNVGIHACNGAGVKRIDSKIPDYVFGFQQDDPEVKRVQGIRDYKVEQVYWAFTGDGAVSTFPNKVLVFNYATGTWAVNDDSITALGYFQNQTGLTWADSTTTWLESGFSWDDGSGNTGEEVILAGNQEGFIFILDARIERNAPALQITNITTTAPGTLNTLTIINHNLADNDYIAIEEAFGTTYPSTIVRITRVVDADTIIIDTNGTGAYLGGGLVTRVSLPQVLTKQYNFFNEVGTNMTINKVDFLVDTTTAGEFSVQSLASSSPEILETLMVETKPYPVQFYPLEQSQTRVWHSMYPNLNGEVVQFNLIFSDSQMRNTNIAWSALQIHAFMFYVGNTSSRFE